MHITSKTPCSVPKTRYTLQALHPATPNLAARLPAKTNPPGVWISIIGMLKLPT